MDGKMTLEGVRKWHLDCATVYARSGESALADQHQRLADVIDAHLAQPSQAVDVPYDDALNDAGWEFVEAMPVSLPGPIFNNVKQALKAAIEKWLLTRAISNAQAEGWRDIATAPEELVRVLLWDGKWVSAGAYVDYDCMGWVMDSAAPDEVSNPTHWQPLPAPPTKATPNAHE